MLSDQEGCNLEFAIRLLQHDVSSKRRRMWNFIIWQQGGLFKRKSP